MQCAEHYRVQAYFDGEVDALSASDIERHAERCPDCRTLLEELGRTRARLRRELPFEAAPAHVRDRIGRLLDQEAGVALAAPRAPRVRSSRPYWLGALGGFGAALAAGAAFLLLTPVRPDPVLDELVTAHVRSLMPEHLTDVVSTDRHTVKPWFAGHADVSPVVVDFSDEGYRLIGGRADYLERQRAAVVVYQHGAHVINVFAWVAGQGTFPEATARNGYHLAFWRVGNLQYCAVSDAGWDELRGLAQLLRDLGARQQTQ